MIFNEEIGRAIDLIADGKQEEAEFRLQQCIQSIKSNIHKNMHVADCYLAWGVCLSIQEEYQQAVLKFEKVLELEPNHEEALWQIVTTLWYNLASPEAAHSILMKRLIHLYPKKSRYRQLQKEIEHYLFGSPKSNKKRGLNN